MTTADTSQPVFRRSLNVLFDDDTYECLTQLAQCETVARAVVVRAAIRNLHRMKVARQATCADGQTCHCPHVHFRQAPK